MHSLALMSAAGLEFASWLDVLFFLTMIIPLTFFAGCIIYLLFLSLHAIPIRSRLASLDAPDSVFTSSSSSARLSSDLVSVGNVGKNLPHFALLIPAHNEELVLGAALASLHSLDYPADAFSVVVIADNCNDDTAGIARMQGAVTLERFNKDLIGKGYALEWALEQLGDIRKAATATNVDGDGLSHVDDTQFQDRLKAAKFDAVVVLDADTQVSPNLLTAFTDGLRSGNKAMQVRYEVLNVNESWRTRLMSCALALVHIVKPMGREHLRLSDGLKGNGMCFAKEVVETVPWSGDSITEDIEYTIRLCRAGYRVAFLPESAVWAQMPTTGSQSASQRKRWEGGRYRLMFKIAPSLFVEGVQKRSAKLCDRAIELIIPPFAEMFALPFVFLIASLAPTILLRWKWSLAISLSWGVVLLLEALYLFGGLWISKVPASTAISALYAPAYIVWKLGVYGIMIIQRSAGSWKRTERRRIS